MAFSDNPGLFVDVERLNGENMTALPAICDALTAAGVVGVRNFMCWNPDQGSAFGYWPSGSTPPSDARIQTTLGAWKYIISRGLKLIGGFTDENNGVSVTGSSQPVMQQHITNCARLAAAAGFDPNMFCPEPVNEWCGWGDNQATNKYRQIYHGILRNALPNHTLSIANDYWGYYKNTAGMWTPGSGDTNWLWQFHTYEDDTQATCASIMSTIVGAAKGAGVKAIYGEWGNISSRGAFDVAANMTDWQNDFFNWSQEAALNGVSLSAWAVTNGSALRLNNDGAWSLRPAVVSSFQYAASSAYKSASITTGTGGTVSSTSSPSQPTAPAAPAPAVTAPFSVSAPGTVTSSASPVMVPMTVTGTAGAALQWIIAEAGANNPWRGALASFTVGSDGTFQVSAPFVANGDFMKVLSDLTGNPGTYADSLPITIVVPAPAQPAAPAAPAAPVTAPATPAAPVSAPVGSPIAPVAPASPSASVSGSGSGSGGTAPIAGTTSSGSPSGATPAAPAPSTGATVTIPASAVTEMTAELDRIAASFTSGLVMLNALISKLTSAP